jgi:putative ABC transport system permease protein
MFLLTYVRRELWHRKWQASFVACGLALGIGLVVTVTAASAGVRDAQSAVLHALYGVGTDVTVTKAPPPATGSGSFFSAGSSERRFDVLRPGPIGVLRASAVAKVRHLPGVAAAGGGAILNNVTVDIPAARKLKNGSLALPTQTSVDGIDTAQLELGPLSSATLKSGRLLRASDASANVAIVDAGYAASRHLHVGSKRVIAGTTFTIVGIVRQPQGGGSVDIYIPLARAQALGQRAGGRGSLEGYITTVYVKAASATDVARVRAEIARALPSATVTSSNSLAGAVSGSLASAASLADDLGDWLATAVLIGAFALASLLTIAAVGRRVREFGTLKALGWKSRLIVTQVLAESAVIGVVGAVIGIGVGFGGAALVKLLAPSLSATVAADPGSEPAEAVSINGGGIHHGVLADATHTVAVHLKAPVTLGMLGLAIVLAVAGALIAGTVGGYRAARLRPAEALGRLE